MIGDDARALLAQHETLHADVPPYPHDLLERALILSVLAVAEAIGTVHELLALSIDGERSFHVASRERTGRP